jgi:uncharacterized phage protein (TIGR01671 family)
MRDYKFRGKRVDNGEWVHGNSLNLGDRHFIIPTITNGSWSKDRLSLKFLSPCYEVDPATVGQYTGLKDKNGRGIYEGDVVEMIGAYGVPFRREAKYVNGYYIPLVKIEYGYNAIDTYNPSEYEVIGNIHENPELLAKEE